MKNILTTLVNICYYVNMNTNITLPKELMGFIDTKINDGSFVSLSDYVSSLLKAERIKEAEDDLRREIQFGLDGPFEPVDDAFFDKKINAIHQRSQSGLQVTT